MSPENEKKLYEKYPKIFVQKDLDITKSCMSFGFECGDGWFWLIDQLCESLQFHVDKNGYEQVEAVQVKEKFGGLRFYTHNSDEYLDGYISFAEVLSNSICDKCGTTKDITHTKGWVRTICKPCLKEVEGEKE